MTADRIVGPSTFEAGRMRVVPRRDSGRFKEGVFGGDKVEVLIQDLLIKADLEGGHERCSRAQSGPDPVGSIGRHPGPARSQRTPLSLALCPDAVAGRYAGRRQRPVLDLPLGTPAATRGAAPARPQAGALPRHVPLLLRTTTSTRPSTWPRPNRCWAPGRKGPDRSEPWRSTASACAGVPRPGTTAARVCTWWRPLPASLGR